MRTAKVYMHELYAGSLSETDGGYLFAYDEDYLQHTNAEAISLSLPLKGPAYKSKVMFPFFDGLIPEGWLLDIAEQNWKLDRRDRMGLLLACCKDCIGAVYIVDTQNDEQ